MSVNWTESGRRAALAVKRGAEVTAHGVHALSNMVADTDAHVADGTQAVARVVGAGLGWAGQGIAAAGQQAGQVLHGNASRAADAVRVSITGKGQAGALRQGAGLLGWAATKLLVHAAGLGANAATVVGKTAAVAGRATEGAAPALGGSVGGAVRGAAEVLSNAVDAAALPASRIDAMRAELKTLGAAEMQRSEALMRHIEQAQRLRRKDELLDLLVVGGMTLAQTLRYPGSVPEAVEQAFELAYPGLAQTESFTQAVERLSSDELVGLVSGVKGKLFEMELVDHLNQGALPDGFHAALAHSATQPGWDIQVTDAHGHVSELLQAKATESVQYVTDALYRYPNIDVTSTTEVHGQLVAMGLAQDVHNSGVSDAVLQAKVEAAAHAGSTLDAGDLLPSSVGLAVIALSVFMNRDLSLRQKGTAFGSRSAKAGASSAMGKLAMAATQTWWLGLIAGVGSGWLATQGHGKREQYEALKSALKVMRQRAPLLIGRTELKLLDTPASRRP